MKTRQIMRFCEFGKEYSVVKIYDHTVNNPYRIYHHFCDVGKDGRLHEHRKQVEKYADLRSCLYWLAQNVDC